MAAAGTWRQQHNSSGRELGPTAHQPRSLTSMLADSRRDPVPPDSSVSKMIDDEVPEAELEGETEFIAVSDDVAPLFHARLLSSPARMDGGRDTSSRELLKDLFPTGFTSNTLDTAAAAATGADECKPASARTLGGAEPELKGPQVWACLMPKAVPATAAVASSSGASEVDRETELLHISAENARKKHLSQSALHPSWGPSHQPRYSELNQPNCDELSSALLSKVRDDDATAERTGLGSSKANATTTTRRADAGAPPPGETDLLTTRRKASLVSDGGEHRVVVKTETADVTGREREIELKHALDRLVSRLAQSQERVSESFLLQAEDFIDD